MESVKQEEFYVGYLPKMQPRLAKFVKVVCVFLFALGICLAVLLSIGQNPFAASFYEFTSQREFEGTIQARPIPFLLIEKPQKNAALPSFTRYPLVGEGKHGADKEVAQFDGQRVSLKGKLIYRDELQMIEVSNDSVQTLKKTGIPFDEKKETLGIQTLKGEIVDSKCYLGVMNPGSSKPHRECAVRCLSGGIPPLFIVRDKNGQISELWLLSEKGEPINKEILDFVAEPIEITGEVTRTGDQLFLQADPNTIRRL